MLLCHFQFLDVDTILLQLSLMTSDMFDKGKVIPLHAMEAPEVTAGTAPTHSYPRH
jgi:hypothetical protein